MPVATANGVALAYHLHGEAGPGRAVRGAPVLLLSPLGYGAWVWREVAEALAAAGLQAVSFDPRGVGGSTRLPAAGGFSPATLAADALGLLDALGLSTAHVVGHSLGGMVAQELALRAPARVERLVLVGTTAGGPPEAQRFTPEGRKALTVRWGDPRGLFLQGLDVATAPGFLARHPHAAEDAWQRRLACPVSPASYQGMLEGASAHDARERLRTLGTPALVVHGAEDRMVPPLEARLLAGLLPHARLRLLEGVGHMVPLEAPGALATEVLSFLAEG